MATFNNPVLYCNNEQEAIRQGMRTKVRYTWVHNASARTGESVVYTFNLEDAERLIGHWDLHGKSEVWGYTLKETSPIQPNYYPRTSKSTGSVCPTCKREL